MPLRVAVWLLALATLLMPHRTRAAEPATGTTQVQLTHLTPDSWLVDYRFARPIQALRLDKAGDYRASAWTVLTPGVVLRGDDEFDTLSGPAQGISALRLVIQTYGRFAPKSYAPFGVFSDGGRALFLGHLQGEVQVGRAWHDMSIRFELKGRPGETVTAPPLNPRDPGGERGYVYFGAHRPVPLAGALVLIDPALPAHNRKVLLDTTAALAPYFERTYGHPLSQPLQLMVSVADLSTDGLSMKGGATSGQLVYRMAGRDLNREHPLLRAYLQQLVAHEMAHLWQMDVQRGGVSQDASLAWIHEGGAEAMALDALAGSGIWTAEEAQAYRAKRHALCDRLQGRVDSYDGIYACGQKRLDQLGVPASALWRALIERAHNAGETYTPALIDRAVQSIRGTQPHDAAATSDPTARTP